MCAGSSPMAGHEQVVGEVAHVERLLEGHDQPAFFQVLLDQEERAMATPWPSMAAA